MRNASHDFGMGHPSRGFAAIKIGGRLEIYDERLTNVALGGRFAVRGSDDRMAIASATVLRASHSFTEILGRITA